MPFPFRSGAFYLVRFTLGTEAYTGHFISRFVAYGWHPTVITKPVAQQTYVWGIHFFVRLVINRYVIIKVACTNHTFLTLMQRYYVTGLSNLPLGHFAKKLHMDKSINPLKQHFILLFFLSWYLMR